MAPLCGIQPGATPRLESCDNTNMEAGEYHDQNYFIDIDEASISPELSIRNGSLRTLEAYMYAFSGRLTLRLSSHNCHFLLGRKHARPLPERNAATLLRVPHPGEADHDDHPVQVVRQD